MAYGQKSSVGLIFQDSYGTAGDVNSVHFIPFLSESVTLKKPPMYSENIRGVFDEGDTYQGANTIDGDLDCEAQPIALGAMLKSHMSLESSVQSGGIYTHTFKPRSADFDENCAGNPVTMYTYLDTGSAMLFSDLNGNTLEMGIANGEFLKAKVGYVGGTFQQNASVAASLPIGKRWTWDTSSISIGGSAIDEINDLTITLEESLEPQHTLNNSLYPSRIKRTGFRTLAVAGTFKFDNQNEYQQFISQSERPLVLNFQGVSEIQSGYYETLKIELPTMRYEEAAPAAEGPGQIEISVTARGKYNVGSGTSMTVTLVNTQATY